MATSRKIFRDPTPAAVVTVHDQVVTGSHVADDCIDHIVDELSGNPVLTHGGTAGSARYVGADFVPPTSGISFQELLPFPATTHSTALRCPDRWIRFCNAKLNGANAATQTQSRLRVLH
jgi:hypothetical protein